MSDGDEKAALPPKYPSIATAQNRLGLSLGLLPKFAAMGFDEVCDLLIAGIQKIHDPAFRSISSRSAAKGLRWRKIIAPLLTGMQTPNCILHYLGEG
jgi:hypothetical protein